jgi:hypothetical protein
MYWINDFHCEKIHPVTFELTGGGLRYIFSMLNFPKEVT